MKQAIFLTGGPGSGKDILIKNIFDYLDYTEYNINQIKENKFYTENIVVVANATDYKKIEQAKSILEKCYYKTSLIFVDVSEEISKQRLSKRNTNEEVIAEKLKLCKENFDLFLGLFENCYFFDNNYNASSNEIYEQLTWINEELSSLLESGLERFKKKIKKKSSEEPYNPLPSPKDGINPTFDTRSAGNGDLVRNYQYESFDPQPLEQGIGMGSNHGNQSNQEPITSLKDTSYDKTNPKQNVFGRIKKILAKKKNA